MYKITYGTRSRSLPAYGISFNINIAARAFPFTFFVVVVFLVFYEIWYFNGSPLLFGSCFVSFIKY